MGERQTAGREMATCNLQGRRENMRSGNLKLKLLQKYNIWSEVQRHRAVQKQQSNGTESLGAADPAHLSLYF